MRGIDPDPGIKPRGIRTPTPRPTRKPIRLSSSGAEEMATLPWLVLVPVRSRIFSRIREWVRRQDPMAGPYWDCLPEVYPLGWGPLWLPPWECLRMGHGPGSLWDPGRILEGWERGGVRPEPRQEQGVMPAGFPAFSMQDPPPVPIILLEGIRSQEATPTRHQHDEDQSS